MFEGANLYQISDVDQFKLNEKVTESQLDITNANHEVSLFLLGDHKASINRHTQRHSKHKTE